MATHDNMQNLDKRLSMEEKNVSYLTSTVKGNIVMSQGSPPYFPLFYTFLSYNLPSLLKWNKSPQVQVSRSELYVSKPPVLNNLSSYSLDKGFTIDTEKNDKATQKARVIWDELCSGTK